MTKIKTTDIDGSIAVTEGGTGYSFYTDGQLLIGKTDGTLAKATLTAGTGITVTNGDGSITIDATGGGTGTVTSVATSTSSAGVTLGGSPITTSGTLTVDLDADIDALAASGIATATNGQLLIGDGSGMSLATLTSSDSSVTITNGAGSIDLTTSATPTFLKARAYLSSAASSPSGAFGKVLLDTASFDTGSIFDATNNRFVPNIAGYYQVNGSARVSATGSNISVFVYKNGSVYSRLGGDDGSSSTTLAQGASDLVYCNGTTDYIELWVYTSASKSYTNTTDATYMSLVGPF